MSRPNPNDPVDVALSNAEEVLERLVGRNDPSVGPPVFDHASNTIAYAQAEATIAVGRALQDIFNLLNNAKVME